MNITSEINKNKWGIILGGVWGLIPNLFFPFFFKNLFVWAQLPTIAFLFLYLPLTILNLFLLIPVYNHTSIKHSLEDPIPFNTVEGIVIGILLTCIGIILGYSISKFAKYIKSGKINLKKEMKENIIGIVFGALWGESLWVLLLFFSFLGFNRIPMIPYLDTYFAKITIFLPMTLSEIIIAVTYGKLKGDVPNIVGSYAEFFFEVIFLSFFIGIFFGYSINKFMKRAWRWRK